MMVDLPPERRPNLLVIGAAKTGTTWLAGVLGAHPQIFVHPQKELNALGYNNLSERLDEYSAYFDNGRLAKVRCDFSVRYLSSPKAPSAAARLTPDAKLLLVVRNPVDQVQSNYWHIRRQNFHEINPVLPAPDIFEALQRFPDRLLEPALYGKHTLRWLEQFPRERLLILDSGSLRSDVAGALSRLCAFLEVGDFDFAQAIQAISRQEGRGGVSPRGGLSERLFTRLYAAAAHGPYRWLKGAVGVGAADRLKRALRLRQTAELVFFKSDYPRLDAAGRARLFELFREDLQRFAPIAPFATEWSAA